MILSDLRSLDRFAVSAAWESHYVNLAATEDRSSGDDLLL